MFTGQAAARPGPARPITLRVLHLPDRPGPSNFRMSRPSLAEPTTLVARLTRAGLYIGRPGVFVARRVKFGEPATDRPMRCHLLTGAR